MCLPMRLPTMPPSTAPPMIAPVLPWPEPMVDPSSPPRSAPPTVPTDSFEVCAWLMERHAVQAMTITHAALRRVEVAVTTVLLVRADVALTYPVQLIRHLSRVAYKAEYSRGDPARPRSCRGCRILLLN